MVKIQDIYGKDYDIPDLESFVSHIKKYHTINGIPDDSVCLLYTSPSPRDRG